MFKKNPQVSTLILASPQLHSTPSPPPFASLSKTSFISTSFHRGPLLPPRIFVYPIVGPLPSSTFSSGPLTSLKSIVNQNNETPFKSRDRPNTTAHPSSDLHQRLLLLFLLLPSLPPPCPPCPPPGGLVLMITSSLPCFLLF